MRWLALLALVAAPAHAQLVSPLSPPVSPSDLAAIQAQIPQPASNVPPSEMPGGTIGTAGVYRPADAAPVRITRATTVVTVTGGTFSGTWATPFAIPPLIVLTPISTNASIDCQLTAAPTTTTFQGRCFTAQPTALNLTLVTAGLTLNPAAATAAGVSIQAIGIPPTQ